MSHPENTNANAEAGEVKFPDIFALEEIVTLLESPDTVILSRAARMAFIPILEGTIGGMADKAKKMEQGNATGDESVSAEIHQLMKDMTDMGKLRDAYLAMNEAEDRAIEGGRQDIAKVQREFGVQPTGSSDIIDSIYGIQRK